MAEEITMPGVVLVNVGEEKELEKPLEELALLAKTAGYEVRAILTQRKDHPDKAYYIGTGKLLELKSVAEATESEVVVFEDAHHAVLTAKSGGIKVAGVYDVCAEKFTDIIKENADIYVDTMKELIFE